MANEDRLIRDMMRGMAGVMGLAVMVPALAGLIRRPDDGVGPQQAPLSIEIIPGPLAQGARALGLSPQEISPVSLSEWSVGNIARVKITNSTYKTNPTTGDKAYLPYTFVLYLGITVGGVGLNLFGHVHEPASQPAGMTVSKYGAGVYTWSVPIAANQTQPVDIWFDVPQGVSGAGAATARLFTGDYSAQVGADAGAAFSVTALPITVGGGITF